MDAPLSVGDESRSDAARLARRCDFCRQPIPGEPVSDLPGSGRSFCSRGCAGAFGDGDSPFDPSETERLIATGVGALDALLPWGMPAASMVLLAGENGVRHRGLQTELIWRALTRGESAVLVSFVDPPVAVVDEFRAFGWNVLPFLESGDLRIVDCFTNRLREEHRTPDRQTRWNAHVHSFLDDAVARVREPDNLREIETRLHGVLGQLDAVADAVVVIDSIQEASSQGRKFRTEQFVAEIRADVAKRLAVPIFVSTTVSEEATFAHEHGYLFDGIVDMRHDEGRIPTARIKEISVRKMDGVRYLPYWVAYENVDDRGFRPFDPDTQLDAVYGHPDRVGSAAASGGAAAPDGASSAVDGRSATGTRSGPGPGLGPTR